MEHDTLKARFEQGAKALQWLSEQDSGCGDIFVTLEEILSQQTERKNNVSTLVNIRLRKEARQACEKNGLSQEFSKTLADSIIYYVDQKRRLIEKSDAYQGKAYQFLAPENA